MNTETLQLALAAEDVLRDWGLREEGCVIASGTLGFLEHCVHEMSHAESLGMCCFQDGTSSEISKRLINKRFAHQEETKAWAIEWLVWQELDIPLTWEDLTDGAYIQGVETHEIKALLDDVDIKNMAHNVVDNLRQLSKDHTEEMRGSYGYDNGRWGAVTSGKGPYWVFRHESEAKEFPKQMSNEELMKLAALHIQDLSGDSFVAAELDRRSQRGTQT